MRKPSSLTIIAAALIMSCGGCGGMRPDASEQQQQRANDTARRKIMEAQTLAQGLRFAEAIASYRLILLEYPNTDWAREAKYSIAQAYVSADNPRRDYAVAIVEFDEFLSLYPSDKRAAEAANWRQALKVIIDGRKEVGGRSPTWLFSLGAPRS